MASVTVPRSLDGALLFARLALGVYFFFTGLGKVRNEINSGFGSFARGPFTNMKPGWLPDVLALPYGYTLPWIELVLGLLLTVGLFGVLAAALTGLVLLSIAIAQLFADSLLTFASSWDGKGGPYHHAVIFLALAVLLALTGPGKYSADTLWRRKKGAA